MKLHVIAGLVFCSSVLLAQEDFYIFTEDAVELSPFTVSSSSASGYDPRYRGSNRSNSPVRLIKRADIVSLKLVVSSDNKKPDVRIDSLQKALKRLKVAADERDDILLKTGYVELPLATGNWRLFSSGKSGDEVSSFNFTLITKMKNDDSVFERSAYLNEFIESVDFNNEVNTHYVSSGIGLLKPESHRSEILEGIADEISSMKKVFGGRTEFQISGLDQRLRIVQIDEANLELSLPYAVVVKAASMLP